MRTRSLGRGGRNARMNQRFGVEAFLVRTRVSIRRRLWLAAWALWRLNLWGADSFERLPAAVALPLANPQSRHLALRMGWHVTATTPPPASKSPSSAPGELRAANLLRHACSSGRFVATFSEIRHAVTEGPDAW